MSSDIRRRRTLRRVVRLMMLMVFAGLAWVVSGYMSQPTAPRGQSGLDIDLTGLAPGDYMIVRSGQRKIIVWHRTDEMLAQLMNAEEHLQDPDSSKSQQPSAAANPYRSIDPRYLVVLVRNDTQGCEVQVLADVDAQVAATPWFGGFKNSCREIYYDLAGRSYKHREEPHNLDVPPHQVLAGKLYIMAED